MVPRWNNNRLRSWYTTIESNGIYLIDTNRTNNKILYSGPGAYSPTWSPDGEWIAFSDNGQIFKIKVNGDSLTQLTNSGNNFFPSWSYDGKWITFDSNKDSPNGMNFIWKMDVNGIEKTRIAYDPEKGEIRMPSWTINNRIIHIRYLPNVFSSEIFIMDEDGANPERLTFNYATDYYPRYSNTNEEFVFTSQPFGNPTNISKSSTVTSILVNNAYSQDILS